MMYRYRILLVLGTTFLASTAGAAPQVAGGGGRVSVRSATRATTRDSSLRVRQEQLLLRLDSLRWQIDHVRMTEPERSRLAREMERTVSALESSLDEAMRGDVMAARLAVEGVPSQQPRIAPGVALSVGRRTRGYLGITFDGPSAECNECKEHIIRFYQYPKIAMVEADSPAERAGILEGDTLLAFNGTDVKSEISLTKLLIPSSRITVRVRRDGDAKDLRVTVGEAPDYYVRRATPIPSRAQVAVPARPPGQVNVYEPSRTTGRGGPATVIVQTPMASGTMWAYSTGIAGAQVATISEGLGRTVGAKEGVLVIRAEPGTPAHRSGLRDGDVILRAGGRNVATVAALRRLVAEADSDEGLTLRVRREKKERDVTLRWQ
jgi:hypothetical protein